MTQDTKLQTTFPEGFEDGSQILTFKRKNRYSNSPFELFELNTDGELTVPNEYEITEPLASELWELNPKQFLLGVGILIWFIGGFFVPLFVLKYGYNFQWDISIFLGFFIFIINFVIIALTIGGGVETKYIIKHRDRRMLLTKQKLTYSITKDNYENICSITFDGYIASKSWNKEQVEQNVSESALISFEGVQRELEVIHYSLGINENAYWVEIMENQRRYFELFYTLEHECFVFVKLVDLSEVEIKLGLMTAFVAKLWTIRKPMG